MTPFLTYCANRAPKPVEPVHLTGLLNRQTVMVLGNGTRTHAMLVAAASRLEIGRSEALVTSRLKTPGTKRLLGIVLFDTHFRSVTITESDGNHPIRHHVIVHPPEGGLKFEVALHPLRAGSWFSTGQQIGN